MSRPPMRERDEPAPYPTLSTAPGPGPVPPTLADHDHTGNAGDGGDLPTLVHLAGAEALTGKKTFPADGTNCPVLRGLAGASKPAFILVDDPEGANTPLNVYPSVAVGNLYPHPGTMMTTDATGTMSHLNAGLLKNSGATGVVTIATKADLPGHDHTATGEGGVIDYATEEYVNNAVAQVINVASGRTLTVGTETSGTYASTHVHDNTPWRVREAAATPGLNVELTFGATTAIAKAPTALWLRAYHNGQHTITVSIYNYTTAAWESYQVLPAQQSSYTFYSIPIPDGANHISAGLARVQFAYTGEGSLNDYLYVDYCALVKGGQGSETVDATRTWTTKQTFPSDAYAPEMGKIELGHATDTTLTRTGAGDIAVEGNHIYRAGGTDVAVADGGTGASTLAGAGITTFVGTPYNGVGLTCENGPNTIGKQCFLEGVWSDDLESYYYPHPAGFYRVSVWMQCTTAGAGDSIKFSMAYCPLLGTSGPTHTIPMANEVGTNTANGVCTLATVNKCFDGAITFYSAGCTAWDNGGPFYLSAITTETNSPIITVRARLEYLGA